MSTDHPAIVITGAALASSLGTDRETTWQAILAGRNGFGPMTAMESPLPAGKDGAQAIELPADFSPDLPREARYLKWTIAAAVADAGLIVPTPGLRYSDDPDSSREKNPGLRNTSDTGVSSREFPYAPSRCAMLLGTTLHGMRAGGQFLRTNDYSQLKKFPAGATLKLAAGDLPFAGPGLTTCSACSSSLGSIALAITMLQTGQADCVIAGGYDTISEYVYGGFNSLRLVTDGPLRPFSKNRGGMKLAEGYGIVVLERADDAARRRAPIVANILGWGESADAHHLTQPHPQGDGAARAMAAALRRANLKSADIDLIAAHATGTPDNDAGEFAALSRTFGDDLPRVPVVGFKSHLGHTLGGAGAVELILSAMALRDQTVPACANITADDIEFAGLNVSVGKAKTATIRATLNTSLGFGGANTCVVLGPALGQVAPVDVRPHPNLLPEGEGTNPSAATLLGGSSTTLCLPQGEGRSEGERRPAPFPREVFITGIGVIAPGILGREGLLARLGEPQPASVLTAIVPEAAFEGLLNARRIRRMSEYVKLQLAAATLAIRDAGFAELNGLADEFSAILGSAHGCANYSYTYYEQIVREGVIGANPMLFAEGVPNAGAAHISLMLNIKGACQSVIGTRTAGLDALALAAIRIAAGEWDRAIVGAGEEDSDVVRRAYGHCELATAGEPCGAFGGSTGFICAGGAAAMVLESRSAMEARGGRAIGSIDAIAFGRGSRDALTTNIARVLQQLGSPANVLSSAAGTWLDEIEAAALQSAGAKQVGSIYGHLAETFSASPLIGIAAVLAAKSLPRLIGSHAELGPSAAAAGWQPIDSFVALCTDPTGLATGVRLNVL